ncbi:MULTISPECIES: transposase [unclassified Virgibacillus]|nr:transposase [Virgibacillus sp. LDC-1]
MDIENKEFIDILPDIEVDMIKKYLQSRDISRVKMVVMDLLKSFKQAVC